MKKIIGKLISIKFTDRRNLLYGIVIDYNDEWTLFKSNPVDYVIDGFIVFRNKNIKGYRRDVEEKFKEKVIQKKGLSNINDEAIPINNIVSIITFISEKFDVFQISTKSEKAIYLGRLKSVDDKFLIMYCINTKGKPDGQIKFKVSQIRFIEYNTDYINSLKLLMNG